MMICGVPHPCHTEGGRRRGARQGAKSQAHKPRPTGRRPCRPLFRPGMRPHAIAGERMRAAAALGPQAGRRAPRHDGGRQHACPRAGGAARTGGPPSIRPGMGPRAPGGRTCRRAGGGVEGACGRPPRWALKPSGGAAALGPHMTGSMAAASMPARVQAGGRRAGPNRRPAPLNQARYGAACDRHGSGACRTAPDRTAAMDQAGWQAAGALGPAHAA